MKFTDAGLVSMLKCLNCLMSVLGILTICNMAVVLKLFLSPAVFLVAKYPFLQ